MRADSIKFSGGMYDKEQCVSFISGAGVYGSVQESMIPGLCLVGGGNTGKSCFIDVCRGLYDYVVWGKVSREIYGMVFVLDTVFDG